jgi:hypothetical protein
MKHFALAPHRRGLFTALLILSCGVTFAGAATPLAPEAAYPIVDSFVDYCLRPQREDQVFTCVVEESTQRNPRRFENLVFEGVDRSQIDASKLPLIQMRSNTFSFYLTGRRHRLVREFCSNCIHTLCQNELTGTDPLSALGTYSRSWDTNYALCHLYDALGRLGFQKAQSTPGISSALTEEEGPPLIPFNFRYLYRLEPEVAVVALGLLGQTNVIRNQPCNPVWEDFSRVFGGKTEAGIRTSLATGNARVFQQASENEFLLEFRFGNGNTLRLAYHPGESIPIASVDFQDARGTFLRRIRKHRVEGKPWFAEWSQTSQTARNEGAPPSFHIYYFDETNRDAETELARFSEVYLERNRLSARKDRFGTYTEYRDGKKSRVYTDTENLWNVAVSLRHRMILSLFVVLLLGVGIAILVYYASARR